ncbi:hypothetical protein [Flaviaesturariibacter aridisoli]|uniref:Uncharacterized protein n=1 Tax=Flaviaesturariibacter aridisoli TaxID=2545761 RepID=A0A4R4DTD9_9BACT|nr:hypothetical protein [Flaviaesturariibacter aridisoli]TCZ65191.1 hypothetical protein E0486_17585 [Flaviaesturariibacter aridisoli]
MRHLFFFFLLIPLLTFSQLDKAKWLKNKFKTADTILLISHSEFIMGSTNDVVDSNGRSVALPKLIINNKLNRAVVKEEKVISGKAVDSLIKILLRQDKDALIGQGGCFVPRQSIIVVKGSETSYIDLCFHCGSYETSKDLQEIPPFDSLRWTELENYFRQHGLTYELDKVD